MLIVLMLISILFFYAGMYIILNKHVAGINSGIKNIAAIVIVFVLISYAYYLGLVFKLDILVLAGLFTLINIALVIIYRIAYKSLFTFRQGAIINSRDIIFPLFIVLVLTCYFFIDAKRWGDGDAITIWNMHAQFLFDVNTWKILFKNGAHSDYPLMLPALIAFFWRAAGNISPFIPVLIAYVQLIFIPLLVYFSLYNNKKNWFAWLAISIFVLSNNYVSIALSQGADTLLALFILLSFILSANLKPASKNIVYILGFIAAASTWIKNEGILFFVVFTLMFMVCNYKNRGYLKGYFMGTIIPLLIILSFKIGYPPQNDLVSNANNTGLLLHNITDYHRYFTIGRYIASTLYYFYIDVIILLLLTLILNIKFFKSPLFITIALVIAGYFMIYVTTPFDLHWHLATSADRVLQHFYPALVYGIVFSIQGKYQKAVIAE